MRLELSFQGVCEAIKNDDPSLIDAIDTLLGLALVCSPAMFGPPGYTLLPFLAAKDELIKLAGC